MGEAAKSALEYRQGGLHELCTFFPCAQFNDYLILPLYKLVDCWINFHSFVYLR